ncbi:thioesterase [Oxalobacteraceae bacterium OM1]|nr:thioesterase [Oxalobacteraceae bacterium OM1]
MQDIHPAYPYTVAWGDLDANDHLRNTAYLDYAAQTRFLYLRDRGFTPLHFREAGIGPVVLSEQISYFKELRFLEVFAVTMHLGGMSPDGSKFIMVNRFLKQDGRQAAEVATRGAWFDLRQRRVAVPPEALTEALLALPRTESFEAM